MRTVSLEEALREFESGECDNTNNGRCTECGECCGRFLPMSDGEVRAIKRYVKENNIKTCRHGVLLNAQAIDLACPFLDESKRTHKCRIYKARPLICRLYKCNKEYDKEAEKRFWKQKSSVVDMWEVFGDDKDNYFGKLL